MNWTKPRHIGIDHDVWMERVPLDGPKRGPMALIWRPHVNDAVVFVIPWFVRGGGWKYGILR
jgi:hypothetical protein